jgi:glycosyltransferase involved in cell wall biosynthesis
MRRIARDRALSAAGIQVVPMLPARGKGLRGPIKALPLGYDEVLFHPGTQSLDDDQLVLALVGRVVPEKGVLDAIQVLAAVRQERKAVLWLVGGGPDQARAQRLADGLGCAMPSSRAVATGRRACPTIPEVTPGTAAQQVNSHLGHLSRVIVKAWFRFLEGSPLTTMLPYAINRLLHVSVGSGT